jgi:dynein intermediate chain
VVVDNGDGGGDGGSTTTNNNNLDSYIVDLLNTKTPVSLAATTVAVTSYDDDIDTAAAVAAVDNPSSPPFRVTKNDGITSSSSENEKSSDGGGVMTAPTRIVETYEIAIQCCAEEDIPPPVLVEEEDEEEDDDDDDSKEGGDDDDNGVIDGSTSSIQNQANNDSSSSGDLPSSSSSQQQASSSTTIVSLSHDERSKVLSSTSFARFLSDAGRRVERLLGSTDDDNSSLRDLLRSAKTVSSTNATATTVTTAATGIDYGVDYANDNYDDDDNDGDDDVIIGGGTRRRHKKHSTNDNNVSPNEAYRIGGHFTACVTYEFPRFTKGRCITDIEWCPGHGEWLVASYGSTSSSLDSAVVDSESSTIIASTPHNNPATRKLSPNDLPSSSLNYFASSSSIPDEGIVAIYNLSMPGRPEHVFCAGCPILKCCFHPTEGPRLVVGGASSGQLLVWDARAGRYPVQRSGGGGGGGHDRELVGMRIIGGEGGAMAASMLVTASSDGKVNYWSASNLREPVEHVVIDANLSCLEVLQGVTEGLVCGDERGGMHAVLPGTGRDGTGSNKRSVRMLHPGASLQLSNVVMEDGSGAADGALDMGHYGMVTGVAARNEVPATRTPRGVGTSTTMPIITSKGFSRGLGGLVITTGVDWSTKLWAPAHHDGPLTSFLSNSYDYMCDVQWSPVHPSIFATASSNGTMNIWNLASTIDQPINGTEGIPISGSDTGADSPHQGLNRLQWSSDGRRLAVASGDKLQILGVGEHIWKAKGNEEGKVMSNLISRGFILQE